MPGRTKRDAWRARKERVRKKVGGSAERPRLSVFRSGKHIYCQLIDDLRGVTLAAASSLEKEFAERAKGVEKASGDNAGGAAIVGKMLAERAMSRSVEKIVFDRNGYLYHGRVKALAEAVREMGVKF